MPGFLVELVAPAVVLLPCDHDPEADPEKGRDDDGRRRGGHVEPGAASEGDAREDSRQRSECYRYGQDNTVPLHWSPPLGWYVLLRSYYSYLLETLSYLRLPGDFKSFASCNFTRAGMHPDASRITPGENMSQQPGRYDDPRYRQVQPPVRMNVQMAVPPRVKPGRKPNWGRIAILLFVLTGALWFGLATAFSKTPTPFQACVTSIQQQNSGQVTGYTPQCMALPPKQRLAAIKQAAQG